MYVEHVKHIKAYNFLNNGPIYNLLALLEFSCSPLFTQHISYILMSNMSNRVQKILLVFIGSNFDVCRTCQTDMFLCTVKYTRTLINNMMPNSKFSNKEILRFNPLIYKVLRIKLPKNSNYNYFELN